KRFKTIKLYKVELNCLVDTGADVSIMKSDIFYNTFPNHKLHENKVMLSGLGVKLTQLIGYIHRSVRANAMKADTITYLI
ncbi:unnamed protein product, partial [Ceratitis capitata]